MLTLAGRPREEERKKVLSPLAELAFEVSGGKKKPGNLLEFT